MTLQKALDIRLFKAKYIKRTGGPGHYKYIYKEKKGRKKRGVEKETLGQEVSEAYKKYQEAERKRKKVGKTGGDVTAALKEAIQAKLRWKQLVARQEKGLRKEGKKVVDGVYSIKGSSDIATFASGDYNQLIRYVMKETGDDRSTVTSKIKQRKDGAFVYEETEDIYD